MKALKIVMVLVVGILILAGSGFTYLKTAYPKMAPPQELRIQASPERLQRGKYLADHVAMCTDCHSERDFSRFAGPVVPGTFGKGGERFDTAIGIPGVLHAPNITPAALSKWSDGEIMRAVTEGVSRDGRPLFPLMAYPNFAQLSEEDVYSIIAYIRTFAPVENQVPASTLDFPVNLIARTIPKPVHLPKSAPDRKDTVAYGSYLVTAASCFHCHTQSEKGEPLPGMDFAGGAPFQLPNGTVVRSANITPDRETGIGTWTREAFIARFKGVKPHPVKENEFNTPMPWLQYQGMTDEDLGSVYDFLQSVKPVKNAVDRFTPAGARDVAGRD